MNNLLGARHTRALMLSAAVAATTFMVGQPHAAPIDISDIPVFLQEESVPPLNMLVLGRDHKLYYEAYNDASDLNGDGVLDIRYKPADIDYFGYFDSYKCYTYSSGVFEPQSVTTNKQCSGQWSGDFLNYLTTARIDALRKVLYGGYRSTDTASDTILERTFVPQDAHSWGKEYTSVAVDGYDIRNYSPLSLPNAGTRHLFANTTPRTANGYAEPPRLRYLTNRTNRIWNWVSKEAPVAGDSILDGGSVSLTTHTNDLYVRVRVCVSGLLEQNCRLYPDGNYKPIGLLQEFGENDSMYFGLLTGSYAKNTSGGVLRRTMGSIRDEVNVTTDGTFRNFNGIVTSINRLRITGFGGNNTNWNYSCGWITNRPINEGECQVWGNPIAEMMYESLRYLAGRGTATSAFSTTFGQGEESQLPGGGLPVATWNNPYSGRPVCSKPFQTVVSDINPSYDSALPGNSFGETAPADALGGLNVATLGATIWDTEFGGEQSIFIGQSGNVSDGAPTAKTVTSFGNIRGLAPEEPTKQGTYYSASVAYHGRQLSLGSLNNLAGDQSVNTFAVALASPLPKIEIPVGDGRITLVPFAKSVYGPSGYSIDPSANFQPTNQIVDFYVESIAEDGSSGVFRVNFEDVEQGADHDMDAIATYRYQVNADNTVTVNVTSDYAAGSIVQHLGYIVSGSTADGTYLVVRDSDTGVNGDYDYFLDTPPEFTGTPPAPNTGTGRWNDGVALPLTSTRSFSPSNTPSATFLKDPLWYAAKWGGFRDTNGNGIPDGLESDAANERREWDSDGDGVPDNYFLVTNALTLGDQLRTAFRRILQAAGSASSASVNSGSISSDTRVYQATFDSDGWHGELIAYPVDTQTGALLVDDEDQWKASGLIPAHNSRKIITTNSDGTPVPFQWASLDDSRKALLQPDFAAGTEEATLGALRLDYLRGDQSNEMSQNEESGLFRRRVSRLGDIVASSPLYVGRPPFFYRDDFENQPYSAFRTARAERTPVVYVGANDGMLHAFNASTGAELMSFIPSAVFPNLRSLSEATYSHLYFVDGAPNMGDVFFGGAWRTVLVGGLNKGGQQIYALNITNPSSFSEDNADDIVLWEFGDRDDGDDTNGITGDPDLGYTFSQPAIVKLQNGRWAAIFGNGYNNTVEDGSVSATGNAVLFIVDIETGKLIRKIDTGQGVAHDPAGTGRPNGLSTPAVVDVNGDMLVDYVYAGDLFGNLWKFDLRATSPSSWGVAYTQSSRPAPLFVAQTLDEDGEITGSSQRQPITSRPEVVRGPRGVGMMVLFGTGKFLSGGDKIVDTDNPELQAYYGIFDRNSGLETDIVTAEDLLQQSILAQGAVDFETADGTDVVNHRYRVTSQLPLGNHRGWTLPLIYDEIGYEGERQVSNTVVRAGRVIFTTLIPDNDPCVAGGSSWLMELDALSGARLADTPFDLNRDGIFDGNDFVEVVVDGQTIRVPVSGIDPGVGISPEPGILMGEGGNTEYKYTPGTTGAVSVTIENPGPRASGRQSWRQIR